MSRRSFDQELEEIKQDVIKMGKLAKEAVYTSVRSLAEQDLQLVDKVFAVEDETDVLNLSIEDRCLRLTALQQPVARDLRFIAAMMRISYNFERMADHAAKIAEITKKTASKPLLKPLIDIPRMAGIISEMVDINLQAIAARDVKPTEELSKKDDLVDALYEQVYKELLTFMIKDPKTIDDATHLLIVALYLERIGDIACTTGSRIVYMIEGRRVWIK
ncbi:MAG: phosphate signaling complex protein PhoU [Euryarchaeota archaeon]|nr:phosphate signaling complex protein PhoU [Euryarchaeota archaeon]